MTRSSLYLISRGTRSLIKSMKYMEYPRLIGKQFHGWRVLFSTTRLSSCRGKSVLLRSLGALSRRQNCWTICSTLERQDWLVYAISWVSWVGQYRWRISRVRVEDFPRHTTLMLLQEVQNMMEKDHIHPEEFQDRIIFMSMHNDFDWGQKGNNDICRSNFSDVAECARTSPRGEWSFFGPVS